MVVIVTGDRNWSMVEFAERVTLGILAKHGGPLVIRHGDCEGVDASFRSAAFWGAGRHGVETDPHPADWSLGKRAGPVRNAAMVAKGADLCLAFHRYIQKSRGTKDCACRAIVAGIPTWLVAGENMKPERLRRDDPRLADWFKRYG